MFDHITNQSGVYAIENINTGDKYIGSSSDINKRVESHFHLLNLGKHHSVKMQRSYNSESDKSVFVPSVVEIVDDVANLFQREQHYIDKFNSFYDGYNCSQIVSGQKDFGDLIAKTNRNILLDNAYEEFWRLCALTNVKLSDSLQDKMNRKYYKGQFVMSMISVMNWILEHYQNHQIVLSILLQRIHIKILRDDGIPLCHYWKVGGFIQEAYVIDCDM